MADSRGYAGYNKRIILQKDITKAHELHLMGLIEAR